MRRVFLLLLCSWAAARGAAPASTESGRLVRHLEATRLAFLEAVAGLTDSQWSFKASADRWSVAECAEHIAASEDFIFEMVTAKVMKSPAGAVEKRQAAGKDDQVLKFLADRAKKFQAPEPVRPSGRWSSREAVIRSFQQSRARTLDFAGTAAGLRDHAAAHPAFQMLDAYGWLLFLSAHSERHVAQIHEVKAAPDFPGRQNLSAKENNTMSRIVHFEIPADNPEGLIKFYGKVFGWQFQKFEGPMEYWLVTTGPDSTPGINGGLLRRQAGATTVNTVGVPSVDAAVSSITASGGKNVVPKMAIPTVGYVAYCLDPDGNMFGVYQHDPSAK